MALVFDAETRVDEAQRLLFASYRLFDMKAGVCLEEGLFYDDELGSTDPKGLACLTEYVKEHSADGVTGRHQDIRLLSAREFLDRVLWPAAQLDALLVGFNLGFDLTRLAQGWGEGHGLFRRGFSLKYWSYNDKKTGKMRPRWSRPRIRIKIVDSKRSFMEFTQPKRQRGDLRSRGPYLESHFLDLRTLGFALTNVGHTLESACKAFGVEHGKTKSRHLGLITPEYIDYNRRDVLATLELLLKMRAEFDRHPIPLDPCRAYSPASVSKAYMRAMGILPPLEKFVNVSKEVLGYAMIAYYGGRAECHIRKLVEPVVYLDFRSMYPTVNTLMGMWRVLSAASLQIVDATEEARKLLERATVDGCFDHAFWKDLLFFARIEPDGDFLPVRAEYSEADDSLNIGVNPFTSRKSIWYSGPDLVASKILCGKAPRVIEAFKLVPVDLQTGLRSVSLRGIVKIDPERDDLFRVFVEQRQAAKGDQSLSQEERKRVDRSLKVNANAGSYGIFAEMNREDLAAKETARVTVYGLHQAFTSRTIAPESPGEFFFAPTASLITGAARLMLALLERRVTDSGGTFAFMDTDSIAVVATEAGGFLPDLGARALSWAEVDHLVDCFALLNPYDHRIVPGSIVKTEKENYIADEREQLYVYSLSAKRYALFNLDDGGNIRLRKCSKHGLGHLLNPKDPDEVLPQGDDEAPTPKWVESFWEIMIARELGQTPTLPNEWIDRPALSRVSATTPEIVRRLNQGRKRARYADQIKPTNFILAAHLKPMGHPAGVDPEKLQLIAPYSSEPGRWSKLPWVNRYTGEAFSITTRAGGDSNVARVKSYRDVLEQYPAHPESKSVDANGMPCTPSTRGLLTRRHVYAGPIYYIGKESNDLEEVELGLRHAREEVQQKYLDPAEEPFKLYVVPILRTMPRGQLARLADVSGRYIQYLLDGKRRPGAAVEAKLTHAAAEVARVQFASSAAADDLSACAAFVSLPPRVHGA